MDKGFKIQVVLFILNKKLLNSRYIQLIDKNRIIYARYFRNEFSR